MNEWTKLPPHVQSVVDQVKAQIAKAPKHPLYDIVVNEQAMLAHGYTGELIIGWRAKIQWDHEEYRRRIIELTERVKLMPVYEAMKFNGEPARPVWGFDMNVSLFVYEQEPAAVFSQMRQLLDRSFLDSLAKTRIESEHWVWAREARFA